MGVALCDVGGLAQADTTALVYVAVSDARGTAVVDLQAADFVVTLAGREVRVLTAALAAEPPAVVFLPNGFSREDAQLVRAALRGAVATLHQQHPHARVSFMLDEGTGLSPFFDLSTDAVKIGQRIGRFDQSGEAAPLIESVSVAARALGAVENRRRIVWVLTPAPVRSTTNPLTATDALRENGVELWAIGVGLRNDPRPSVETGLLQEATRKTGGRFNDYRGLDIVRATTEMSALLSRSYSVTFESLSTKPASLRVGVRRAGVTVSARTWDR